MDVLPDHVLKNQQRQKFDSVRHKIRIMQAYVDGKPILCKNRDTMETVPDRSPSWNWETYSYMIAHRNYNPNYTSEPGEGDSSSSSITLEQRLAEIDAEFDTKPKGFIQWIHSLFT